MRKIVLFSAMILAAMSVKAQLVNYTPVYVNPPRQTMPSQGLQLPPQIQSDEELVDIGAYYVKNNQFARLKIRVKENFAGGYCSVNVVGYYGGALNKLIPSYALASRVNKLNDGEVIANNFEWKARISTYGTIYFNL